MRNSPSLMVLIVALLTAPLAMADSACNMGQQLIGTKAIGLIGLYALEGKFALNNSSAADARKDCLVKTYDAPNGKATTSIPCPLFYLTQAQYEETPASGDYYSDYFRLNAFATDGAFVQLHLAEGTPIWAKSNDGKTLNPEIPTAGGVFPANQIFAKPDRAFPAPPVAALDDTKIRDKIHALFEGTAFAKKDVIAHLRGKTPPNFIQNNQFDVDFVYSNAEPLTATDGTQWLKAEERLQWDWSWTDHRNKPPKPDKKFGLTGDRDETQFRTEPLRTVYIPIRDANGIVLNVAGYGNLYCD